MATPNNENGSPEETQRFFQELGRIIDFPPLTEEFHERLRENLKNISSSTEGSAQAQEIPILPPSDIQPLTQDLVEATLDALGMHWEHDTNNDPMVRIQRENSPFNMTCWFCTDERHNFILACLVFPPIPKSKFIEAVFLCNEYAMQYHFGRFKLEIEAEKEEATLWFAAGLTHSAGTTAAFLQNFIVSHLSRVEAFLSKSSVQQSLGLDHGAGHPPSVSGRRKSA
jgi:hypothetical protein